jgi:hypothetical protein
MEVCAWLELHCACSSHSSSIPSFRTAATPERFPRWAKTGYLHPIQARIVLQLMIASGYDQYRINAAFEDPIRKATNHIWEY